MILRLAGGFQFLARPLVFLECLPQFAAALLERLGGRAHIGLVAEDFHQANHVAAAVVHRHHHAAAPEPGPVLALMPALVGRTSLDQRRLRFLFRDPRDTVLGGEDQVGRLIEDLVFAVTQQAFRARVPARDASLQVHRDDRVFARVLDDQSQAALAQLERFACGDRVADIEHERDH